MTAWVPVLLAGAAAAVTAARSTTGTVRLAALSALRYPVARPSGLVWLLPLAAALLSGLAAAAIAAGAVVALRRALDLRRHAAARDRERARALDALALLGADLRAGRTPADALAAAASVACGPSAGALAAAAATARLGGDVPGALDAPSSAVPTVLRGLAACWQVCHEAGTGLAAAVERLEDGLRAAEAQRRAVAAELAGPRATAQLLAVLPVVGIVLAAALGARPAHFLLHTPLGLGCLVTGLLLDGAGVLWTQRLATGAMP
ncbi:MAG: type II secretion system F family protein [Frankiaceae bacterium]|nr:type II secretion system F family protein [Frankiaceae bacterium]